MSTGLASAPVELQNPWPGLAPYTEQQCGLFFGREAEIEELLRLIERETLTILFGRSGSGKSSLLHAGVIPRLRTGQYFPVLLRLNFANPDVDPVAQVKAITLKAAGQEGLQTDSSTDNPTATLWEFFHSTDFWGPRNDRVTPLLIFDQFEEAFTIGKDQRQASNFLEQLADLAENRIPLVVQKRIQESAERINIDLSGPSYKIIVSLREDFVSRLDQLRPILPAIMRNRMGLLPLDGTRALQVIVNSGKPWVSESVAQEIVAALAGETGLVSGSIAQAEIEPAYLSVMCHELFRRMAALGLECITSELVARERGEILEAMYERSFEGLPAPLRLFVEDRLLTSSGFRGTLPLSEALAEGLSLHDLETLVDRRLLRFEDRLGTRHVELSHDLLTGVVKKSRELRAARVAREEEERKRDALRRSFRTRAKVASILGAVAFAILGSLTIWAVIEEHNANRLKQDALNTNRALQQKETQLQNYARELKVQRDKARTEEQQANQSSQEIQTLQQKTLRVSGVIMRVSDTAIPATYQNALRLLDEYRATTSEGERAALTSSLWDLRNQLQEELTSVNALLAMENDPSAKTLKLTLLFYIADLEFRAYGFDQNKYQAFLAYAQSMLGEKDELLQAKALLALARAADMMLRKPDQNAARTLLREVQLKSAQLQRRGGGLNGATWDAMEDVYEECAQMQKSLDAKDAISWFGLAVQAEIKAAGPNPVHLSDVGRIADMFGDFEKQQGDYPAAIREYSIAIQYSQQKAQRLNGGKPDLKMVEYQIDRGDAEHKTKEDDQARQDYAAAAKNNDQLADSPSARYNRLLVDERLGDLERDSSHLDRALEWYHKEKQIALNLAQADSSYRSSVLIPSERISTTELILHNTAAARAELEDEVSTWKNWAQSVSQSDVLGYAKALLALGDFDSAEKNYETALESCNAAYDEALLGTIRWPNKGFEALIAQSKGDATMAYEALKEDDKALAAAEDAKDTVRNLLARDCSGNLDGFNRIEDLGIIHELVTLKRPGDAQAEAQDVAQFVEKNCASIDNQSPLDARAALAQAWGNLSWESIRAGNAQMGEECAQKGLKLDPTQLWIDVNLAHSWLLLGRVDDARRLYTDIKDKQWDGHPLSNDIRSDFAELRSLGMGRNEMDGILSSLGPPAN
jgi:hypothetical protein